MYVYIYRQHKSHSCCRVGKNINGAIVWRSPCNAEAKGERDTEMCEKAAIALGPILC